VDVLWQKSGVTGHIQTTVLEIQLINCCVVMGFMDFIHRPKSKILKN
jgi:hypothetical protein